MRGGRGAKVRSPGLDEYVNLKKCSSTKDMVTKWIENRNNLQHPLAFLANVYGATMGETSAVRMCSTTTKVSLARAGNIDANLRSCVTPERNLCAVITAFREQSQLYVQRILSNLLPSGEKSRASSRDLLCEV